MQMSDGVVIEWTDEILLYSGIFIMCSRICKCCFTHAIFGKVGWNASDHVIVT